MSDANPKPVEDELLPIGVPGPLGVFSDPLGEMPVIAPAVLVDAGAAAEVDNYSIIRQLNSFLRGEISAAETYRMAIDKIGTSGHSPKAAATIVEIQEEHGRAAQSVRNRIRELGGEPADSSGAWGAWAKAVTGVANIFGDAASLKALKEGEEHGLKDYQEGLDDIDVTSADLVQKQLIPAQQKHIGLLNGLIDQVNRS